MRAVFIFIAATIICAVVTVSWMMIDTNKYPPDVSVDGLPIEGSMPSLGNATAWLNSEPLVDADLRGKVVLINFWTYSCINWRRQLPYIRGWAEKYKDKGLVVIGVHTPEFTFEKDIENVRTAAKEMQIDYPIALDNEYSVWSDFGNRYWPALYFVDVHGNIRHHKFGEGNYEQSEKMIQQLLKEAGSEGVDDSLVSLDPKGAEAAANWDELGSPETYVGFDRTRNFASPGGAHLNKDHRYQFPSDLELNHWGLAGNWIIGREATTLSNGSGGLRHRFQARDLHLVMGPQAKEVPVRFRVLIDGKPPGDSQGTDVDENGYGTIVEPRMYQLIRQTGRISERIFEIQFLDPRIEIFSITFG